MLQLFHSFAVSQDLGVENNIKTDLKEIRWGEINWIKMAQDGNEISCSRKGAEVLK